MAVPVARGVAPAGVTPGLRRQAWLIEAMDLANRSEGLGWSGLVDKREGLGGWTGPGPVDKSEGLRGLGWPRACR